MRIRYLAALLLMMGLFVACGRAERPADVPPVQEEIPTAEAAPSPTPVEAVVEPEAGAETTAAAEAPFLSLHISGGIVGLCDTFTVDAQGAYVLQSCTEGEITGTLGETERELLAGWYTGLADFSMSYEEEVAGADKLAAELIFRGQGSTEAEEQERQIIFDWVNGLFIQARPQPVAEPPTPAPPEIGPEGLCPDVERPAVLVADYNNPSNLVLVDATGQVRCNIVLARPPFGRIVTAGGHIYYPAYDPETETISIWRLNSDGSQAPLEFTTISVEQAGPFNFAVSADGSRIAWAKTVVNFEVEPPIYRNDLWLANIDGSRQVAVIEQQENEERRYLEPVRFVGDRLYYAMQPDGLGGSLFSFAGRFDRLYHVPVTGGEPQLMYACGPENGVCIGDVAADGGALAYVEAGQVHLLGSDGRLINSLVPPAADFVGWPIFGPDGRLAFVSMSLSQEGEDQPPRPNPGYLSLVAPPYTGPPQTVLSGNSVATLWEWVDANHLLYGRLDEENGQVGTAIVNLEGQVTGLADNFGLAVLR